MAQGKVFSIKDSAGTSKIVGNEIITQYEQMFFGQDPLIQLGIIKYKGEAGSRIRVPVAKRILGQDYNPSDITTLRTTPDEMAQAENLLEVDTAKDGFAGATGIVNLDQTLYNKSGELRVKVASSLAKISNNVAQLRWYTAVRKNLVTNNANQQITITANEISGGTQENATTLLKKISDEINKWVSKIDPFSETIPRSAMYFFVAPKLYSALQRTFMLTVRNPGYLNDINAHMAPNGTITLDGIKVVEDYKFLGKNLEATAYHKTETLDMSKFLGILFTVRHCHGFIWGVKMLEEIPPGTGGNILQSIVGMSKSQVFEEFKTEAIGFMDAQKVTT